MHVGDELYAGKQSRVFVATVNGEKAALKLTERRLVDPSVLAERMLVAERVASESEEAIAPVRINRELVHPVGGWLATATPFVAGRPTDITAASDSRSLGRSLARLHSALARLPRVALPPVAALVAVDAQVDRSGWQLLHGDFGAQNTIATPEGLRVFDFDDCGYGPVTYDVANTLYMVLFDAEVNGRHEQYAAFRSAFLEGYSDGTRAGMEPSAVDSMIDIRIRALGCWLDDLANAPIGIRTSSPEWRETLRAFVRSREGRGT